MPTEYQPPAKPALVGHPIAVVAERTGLSRDVLRVWERRYAAVEPLRTAGGQRLYSDAHVARFRLLAAAIKHGRSISQVASIPSHDLARLVAEDELARASAAPVPAVAEWADTIDAAMAYTRALDGAGLDRVLRRAIARNGLTAFLEAVVPQLMHQIGHEWGDGRLDIAHEHLASAAVIAIVLESVRAVPEIPSAPRVLVTTPSGERHAVGAALAAAAAALDGWTVVYLGADVPAADIVAAASATNARAVALSVVHAGDTALAVRELRAVRSGLGQRVPLLVGGAAAMQMSAELEVPGLTVCRSIADFRTALARESVAA